MDISSFHGYKAAGGGGAYAYEFIVMQRRHAGDTVCSNTCHGAAIPAGAFSAFVHASSCSGGAGRDVHSAAGRINNVCIGEGGRALGERLPADIMTGEELVQLAEALVVACYTDVKQPVAVTELYPCRRGDVAAATLTYKIGHPGGVVDVSQYHPFHACSRSELRKALDGEGAVTQTII